MYVQRAYRLPVANVDLTQNVCQLFPVAVASTKKKRIEMISARTPTENQFDLIGFNLAI